MRFGHIELFVREPLESLAFYRDVLHFDVVDVQGRDAVWMALGATQILLRRGGIKSPAPDYRSGSVGFVLYAEDLDVEMGALVASGLQFTGDDGSAREPTFVDPDGHWFQIVDPKDFA